MSFSYPISAEDFFSKLQIESLSLKLVEPKVYNRTATTSFSYSLGDASWSGEMTLSNNLHQDQAEIDAYLDVLSKAGSSFLIYDKRLNGPKEDVGGVILGSSSVVIDSSPTNNSLVLSGLPSGYKLSTGDVLGWRYGSNPTRYAYYRILLGDTANSSGLASVTLSDYIHNAPLGASVDLVRPKLEVCLDVGAEYGVASNLYTSGTTLSFTQVLGR